MTAEAALLEDLFGDCRKIEFLGAPAGVAPLAAPAPDQGPRLMPLLCRDLVCLGFQMAAVASALNGAQRNAKPILAREAVLAFLPSGPKTGGDWLEHLITSTVSTRLLADIREFYARFESLRSLTLSYYRNVGPEALIGSLNADVLIGSWQQLCKRALMLIDAAGNAYPSHAELAAAEDTKDVRRLLAECANGGSPCIRPDGSIEVKGWAERRREARWSVDWSATLLLGSQNVRCKVTNISVGGACIQTSVPLSTSEVVSFELASGQTLTGEVRWSNGQIYGLRFLEPMAADDPLVLGASMKA